MTTWRLPLTLINPNKKNLMAARQHYGRMAAIRKQNDKLLSQAWGITLPKPKAPLKITLVRMYNPAKKSKPWDMDNLIAACKPLLDSIAALLLPDLPRGHGDGTGHGLNFAYGQEKGLKNEIAITFENLEES